MTKEKNAPTFAEFWNLYALKRDKIAAERAWNRLSAKDKQAAINGIDRYCEDCKKRGISRMYAQGYLNHRRWEDEPEEDMSAKTAGTPQPPLQAADAFDQMETW